MNTALMQDPKSNSGAPDDSHIWPPCPTDEEIELGMEELGVPEKKRQVEDAIAAMEKRREFLIKDSREIGAIQVLNPDHAEVLAQQLAENRVNLADTERRLRWLRYQLENKN